MVVAGAVLTMLFLKVTSRTESLADFVFNIHIYTFSFCHKRQLQCIFGMFYFKSVIVSFI